MKLLEFLDESPTPFHVIENIESLALKNKFTNDIKSKKFFKILGDSAGIFCSIPKNTEKIDGFHIIGTHTDSPNLKLRPNALFKTEHYDMLATEVYGGVLYHTWFDRDLSVAGIVFYKNDETVEKKIINLPELKCKIPSLAIHLHRGVNKDGFKINPHLHFNAILSQKTKFNNINELIADKINVEAKNILSYDLSLYDTQNAEMIGYMKTDFISAARLDNLAMTHASMVSFFKQIGENSTKINIFLAFDHEEVGSSSFKGAKSELIKDLLKELITYHLSSKNYTNIIDNSFFVSADMAHALHPNYTEVHDNLNFPILNSGPVIKYNSNQKYTTSAETVAFIRNLADKKKIPLQDFMNRQDLSCGSTIGPSISTLLGLKSIDIGNPMLSMHSIRELAAKKDHGWIIDLFDLFYSF